MVMPATKDRSVYVFKMMERLGIEPSGGVLPRSSLLYATASHRCESCSSTRFCRDWLDHAPASVSFAPPFCANSDILSELQYRNMTTYS
jgi:Family of unknown function (DUF6455)